MPYTDAPPFSTTVPVDEAVRDPTVAVPVQVRAPIVYAAVVLSATVRYVAVAVSTRGAEHTRPLTVVVAESQIPWNPLMPDVTLPI